MSDKKDVGVEQKKEEIEVKDNAKLEEVSRGYRILYFDEKNFLAKKFSISSIRIYDKSVLSISRYGDELFTRTRNKLIKDPEMITQKEQLRILTERGLWGPNEETELATLRKSASDIINEKGEVESLIAAINSDDKKNVEKTKKLNDRLEKIGKDWIDIYSKYMDVVALNDMYFGDTIEAQAQTNQRKGWLVSCVCLHMDKDNKPFPDKYNSENRLWTAVEDFEKEMESSSLISIMTECMEYWESKDEGESFFVESPDDLSFGSDGDTVKNTESGSTPTQNTVSNLPTSS